MFPKTASFPAGIPEAKHPVIARKAKAEAKIVLHILIIIFIFLSFIYKLFKIVPAKTLRALNKSFRPESEFTADK